MNKVRSNPGSFRLWVFKIYEEHKKEREEFKMRPLSLKDYWLEYKNWLKKTFRNETPIEKS